MAASGVRSAMLDLSAFPITRRWPPKSPDRLQLYSLPTPNGVKVSIALEEMGLPYEPHLVDIGKNESFTAEFPPLNPNGKIPAILDPNGPEGKPLALFESGAILLYLADKTGKLMPARRARRDETIQWVFFHMAFIGPMFGQVGYFYKFAGRDIADKRPLERYRDEAKRLLGVLDARLRDGPWMMREDYSMADVSMLGWVRNLIGFYGARDRVDFDARSYIPGWLERGLARPAVQRGLSIPQRAGKLGQLQAAPNAIGMRLSRARRRHAWRQAPLQTIAGPCHRGVGGVLVPSAAGRVAARAHPAFSDALVMRAARLDARPMCGHVTPSSLLRHCQRTVARSSHQPRKGEAARHDEATAAWTSNRGSCIKAKFASARKQHARPRSLPRSQRKNFGRRGGGHRHPTL